MWADYSTITAANHEHVFSPYYVAGNVQNALYFINPFNSYTALSRIFHYYLHTLDEVL